MTERLGSIQAIVYFCDIPTKRGLCKVDKGSPYRHEWRIHHPQLIKDGKNYGIACRIEFKDGGFMEGGKMGIDDLPAGEKQACQLAVAKPNPKALDVIGSLQQIEIVGKDSVYQFQGAVLCVNKEGDRLYIVDRKDVPASAGIKDNPGLAINTASMPTVAQEYGPKAWATLHNFAALYTPKLAPLGQELVTRVIEQFPCVECRNHGMEYLQSNPIDYSSRESMARGIWQFHNTVNAHLGKPLYPWRQEMAPPEGECSDCKNPAGPNIPHGVSDGIVMYAMKGCIHCEHTLAAAKVANVPLTVTYTHNKPATPVLEKLVGGKVVKTRLGSLDVAGIKEFAS